MSGQPIERSLVKVALSNKLELPSTLLLQCNSYCIKEYGEPMGDVVGRQINWDLMMICFHIDFD